MDAKPVKTDKKSIIDLDDILRDELGQFGPFQLRYLALVSIPIIMSAFMSEYIFTASAISHRCRVPECGEDSKLVPFEPKWLTNAMPERTTASTCNRYRPRDIGVNGTLDVCPIDLFDTSVTVRCDSYVYARDNGVVYEFDLGCQDFKRILAGTLNNVGTLLVLPIVGYVSDRYGRRVALVMSVFNLALIGTITAFSVNFKMYLFLQLLQTTLGAGTFSSAYVFAAELVGPKWRVVASATASSMFAVGQVILGGVAWMIQPWRYMILALHIPCFLIISYYWILSESIRWLLSKQKFDEARELLEKISRVNKAPISEKSIQGLLIPLMTEKPTKESKDRLIKTIWNSKILLRRVCTTPIWWISTTFIYYGLSINSISLSDTIYLNYMLTVAIKIPGFYTAVLILDRIGRKATLSTGFFFSAACNIAFVFIPSDFTVVRLIVYLAGKFGISLVFTSLYLYTSELYPTEFRHTLLAFSSMVGRIGSITAPITPVLNNYCHGLPSLLFGGMAILSGLLIFTQPETLGTKMPDTLAEAEAIGVVKQ